MCVDMGNNCFRSLQECLSSAPGPEEYSHINALSLSAAPGPEEYSFPARLNPDQALALLINTVQAGRVGSLPEGSDPCAVCTETFDGGFAFRLHCKHYFHTKCIITWLQVRNYCPMCRGLAIPYSDVDTGARPD